MKELVSTTASAVTDRDLAMPKGASRLAAFLRLPAQGLAYMRRSGTATVGLFLIGFWVLVALLAPIMPIQDPIAIDYAALADPFPSHTHWLGVDPKGRDILSRVIWGGRTVLGLAPIGVVIAYILGCTLGMLSAYRGGWVDSLISRLTDIILAFPVLVLYILLITTVGPSKLNIIAAIIISIVPAVTRLTRGLILELKSRDFVSAAQLRGKSSWYIMFVELLPNARGPIILDACARFGWTIVLIGILGFLGLGLPPPTPDWGGMIREATNVLLVWPHMAILPCIALATLVVGFNLAADGIAEISNRF